MRNDRCYEENSNDDMKVVTWVVVHLFRLDGWTSGGPAHGLTRGKASVGTPAPEHPRQKERV